MHTSRYALRDWQTIPGLLKVRVLTAYPSIAVVPGRHGNATGYRPCQHPAQNIRLSESVRFHPLPFWHGTEADRLKGIEKIDRTTVGCEQSHSLIMLSLTRLSRAETKGREP